MICVVNGEIKAGIVKSDGFAGSASLMQISCIYAAGATLPSAGISGKISISTQPAP